MLHQKLKIVNKRRISQSEIRNSAAEKNWNRKARAGKNSFPPTPFLFARPSNWILKFGIRIFVKKCSNINQKTPHQAHSIEVDPRASNEQKKQRINAVFLFGQLFKCSLFNYTIF